MVFAIFVLCLLFVSQAQAQYSWTIPCRSDENCANAMGTRMQGSQSARCSQGYCLCYNTTMGMYDLCTNKEMILTARPSGLRRNCTKNDDCSVVGSSCQPKEMKDKSIKICLCQSDKVESEDGQSCLPAVAVIGGKCEELKQCTTLLGDGVLCEKNQCRCFPTHHHKNSKCIRNLGFGDICDMKEDGCYEVNARDGDNLMTCTENYGCRCKKHWSYNQRDKHCEYSSASQIVMQFVTVSTLVLLVAFF